MIDAPKTTNEDFRLKWRQLHFLIGVQRSRCKEGKPLVIDSAMENHVRTLAIHEAIFHAYPFHGHTQVDEFTKRYNEVLDYFAPADTTVNRDGMPLRRA